MTPSVDALRSTLDGRWADVRSSVREQMSRFRPVDPDLSREEYRAKVLELVHELAATGQPHTGFSPDYGGKGDVGGVVTAFQALGYGDLSLLVKAGVQWGLFGGAVQVLGTRRHHERHLRQIMDGELLGCFAMTETGHGSDVQHLRTTATYDPVAEEFVIDTPEPGARKDYIGNAARDGRMAVVFAQLVTRGETHGVHAFLVPIRDDAGAAMPGVEIGDCGHKAGLNGVDNGRLTFHSVRVPREALLNRFADVSADGTYTSSIENEGRRFFTMLGTLVRGRISVAGGAGSASQKALALAVRYGERRRQFADPGTGQETAILDYRAHQRKLLPALATTYALQFAQDDLVAEMHRLQAPGTDQQGAQPDEKAQRDLESRAAGIKAIGTWHATHTIQTCREACGGAGYLSENLLPQLKADTDVFTTFEGDNTVLLQLLAKNLLADYGKGVQKLSPLGLARFVGSQALDAAAERTGVNKLPRRLPGRGFRPRDRAEQRRLLADRAEHLLAGVARRLRPALKKGADQFGIFNAAQDHLLDAARAHVDVLVFDAFVAGIERTADPAVKALLETVCDLHALATVERDRAWYLEHGRLTAAETRSVVAAVNALCAELRPHARLLVDGFGIPEGWIACPLLEDPAAESGATASVPEMVG
ncbi:acyl-CoA dehydrogenase family protein [Pseudonocardia kujensis]|uniref:acyl-CoA dehydrogenase family protein n=1 Tax=Pseudonocardia kujensis TaxID=1128675 RepID=UPI001E62E24A|nr:acyl-CoA dehydrogenase [Pseudonocardia kujensis]MCE0761347.1 acyl-CoA dehydrogenase family protein [Pseudonocardia kujensis]